MNISVEKMMRLELPGRGPRGRPKRILKGVVKEDTKLVGVVLVEWRGCGQVDRWGYMEAGDSLWQPLKGTARRRRRRASEDLSKDGVLKWRIAQLLKLRMLGSRNKG